MKKLIAVLFSAFAASAFAGNTYYADASVEVSGDGLTPETAKKTIQEAVDLCATSGDTVKVAEGLYDEGVNVCSYDDMRARVVITNKITLVATGAKEKTIIKGEFDTTAEGDHGLGPNAVRCVYMYYTGSGTTGKRTAGSIVEGFTICGGATEKSGTPGGQGGGISMQASYAVNCIVSNCVAKQGGGLRLGTAVRCLVTDCTTYAASAAHGTASYGTTFLNSIIVHQAGNNRLFYAGCLLVNCTISGNQGVDFGYGGKSSLYNTIFTDNAFKKFNADYAPKVASNCVFQAGTTGWTAAAHNEVVTNSSAYGFAAPAIGDWRPSAEMGAANVGNAEFLKQVTLPSVLEDQRYLDYYGNPIPKTGPITCGAAQEVCAAERGLLMFDGNAGWEIDGFGSLSGTQTALNYIWTDDYPGMFKVRKAGATLANLVWYTQATNGVDYTTLDPNLENWVGVVSYPGVTNKVSRLAADKTIYVAMDGNDDDNDGTSQSPYATIQKAVDKCTNKKANSIVVRRGEYKTGGASSSRVKISGWSTGTAIRIVAEEGPAVTAIVGTRGAGDDGYGEGAFRCIRQEWPSIVQGFTLTGGYISDDGGSVWANSYGNGHVVDCVISNNYSDTSICRSALLIRCRVVDNVLTSASGIDVAGSSYRGRVIGCEIVHSPKSKGAKAIGTFTDSAFSSILGTCDATSNSKNLYLACLLSGGVTCASPAGARYCFFHGDMWTTSGSGKVVDCQNGKSKCVSFAKGDFRLRDDSPALGMVAFDPVDYLEYATLDMDGNPLKLDSLAGNTAGAHQMWSVHYEPHGLIMVVR